MQAFSMTESDAIRHSLARLAKAREALRRLEASTALDDVETSWSDLLLAGNAIFSKLEQGSKATGKATGWFGRVKKIRKDDQLLSYMHHARNAEEHSIEDVTKRMKAGQATLTFREPFDPEKLDGTKITINATSHPGHVLISSSNEELISTQMYDKPSIALVRVKDPRFNDHFDPPYDHLGTKLHDQSPLAIGRLFVDYLAALIEEARTFGV
jgi:hypothetical protein